MNTDRPRSNDAVSSRRLRVLHTTSCQQWNPAQFRGTIATAVTLHIEVPLLFVITTTITVTVELEFPLLPGDPREYLKSEGERRAFYAVARDIGCDVPADDRVKGIQSQTDLRAHANNNWTRRPDQK